jgi:hypothetical protein
VVLVIATELIPLFLAVLRAVKTSILSPDCDIAISTFPRPDGVLTHESNSEAGMEFVALELRDAIRY